MTEHIKALLISQMCQALRDSRRTLFYHPSLIFICQYKLKQDDRKDERGIKKNKIYI